MRDARVPKGFRPQEPPLLWALRDRGALLPRIHQSPGAFRKKAGVCATRGREDVAAARASLCPELF